MKTILIFVFYVVGSFAHAEDGPTCRCVFILFAQDGSGTVEQHVTRVPTLISETERTQLCHLRAQERIEEVYASGRADRSLNLDYIRDVVLHCPGLGNPMDGFMPSGNRTAPPNPPNM